LENRDIKDINSDEVKLRLREIWIDGQTGGFLYTSPKLCLHGVLEQQPFHYILKTGMLIKTL